MFTFDIAVRTYLVDCIDGKYKLSGIKLDPVKGNCFLDKQLVHVTTWVGMSSQPPLRTIANAKHGETNTPTDAGTVIATTTVRKQSNIPA